MPVSMVSASASAFIWATISNMPSPQSVTTAVTSPFTSKRGDSVGPSSRAALSRVGSGKEMLVIAGPACLAEPEPADRSAVSAVPHHCHEPDLLFGIVPEGAGEGRCQGRRALLSNSAHCHAHVLGLDHDGNAARI